MIRRYLIAEYCRGPFYMGWWMYARDRNDGSENTENRWERWGWLQSAEPWSDHAAAWKLCCDMGHEPPPVARYKQDFAEWFAGQFPAGLLVEFEADTASRRQGPYWLLEIVAKLPKQPRGVIRTVRGANQSFRRFCRERAS
jgi:hypothetical protein